MQELVAGILSLQFLSQSPHKEDKNFEISICEHGVGDSICARARGPTGGWVDGGWGLGVGGWWFRGFLRGSARRNLLDYAERGGGGFDRPKAGPFFGTCTPQEVGR